MREDTNNDPFGDKDPLVLEALDELFYSLDGEVSDRNRIVRAIDGLIQARVVIALETLTDAAFPKPNKE